MTAGSASPQKAPVLVLALGNLLLQDDAAGLRMLELLAEADLGDGVELVDGGTQGLTLLGVLEGRSAVVILDAVQLEAPPGTIHLLEGVALAELRGHRAKTAHESGAIELLNYASLLGTAPREVAIVGIEPETMRTGLELSGAVTSSLEGAVEAASGLIARLTSNLASFSDAFSNT